MVGKLSPKSVARILAYLLVLHAGVWAQAFWVRADGVKPGINPDAKGRVLVGISVLAIGKEFGSSFADGWLVGYTNMPSSENGLSAFSELFYETSTEVTEVGLGLVYTYGPLQVGVSGRAYVDSAVFDDPNADLEEAVSYGFSAGVSLLLDRLGTLFSSRKRYRPVVVEPETWSTDQEYGEGEDQEYVGASPGDEGTTEGGDLTAGEEEEDEAPPER